MKYAEKTEVSIENSRAEIERTLSRYGATSTGYLNSRDRAVIMFEAHERRVVFELPLPAPDDEQFQKTPKGHTRHKEKSRTTAWDQSCRQRWRALALVIKAKMEAVESGITSFEAEFLAHIMMPDGQTVGTHVMPHVAAWYASGKMRPLLPGPEKSK